MRRYRRRWKVERTIAWLQNYRRLCIRWEKSTRMFQGMLHRDSLSHDRIIGSHAQPIKMRDPSRHAAQK